MKKHEKEILQNQLNSEKKALEELKKVYEKAAKDCANKIAALSARTDMENLQSIIYQKQYQQALKKQIEGILDVLQGDEFETISQYLQACYEDGFISTMYSLTQQGIPLVVPIDQSAVVKAVQTDSKISKGLYERLGEDVDGLKTNIRAEISRGISNGSTYNEMAAKIAMGMNSPFNKAINNAIRITRTEGNRISNQSAMDAMYKAKEKGAAQVKQWCAALDSRTRSSHRNLDGQIREIDEEFSNGLQYPLDPKGKASEVVNCRCTILKRARWALGEEELNTLKGRAEYYGLDKTEEFEEYKKKYLKAVESERAREDAQMMNDEDTQMTLNQGTKISKKNHISDYGIVDRKLVNSKEYHDKYADLTEHKAVNESMYQEAMKMLEHRDGTPYEDMVVIDARTGKVIVCVTDSNEIGKLSILQKDYDEIVNYSGNLILVHNHPNSSRVSYTDILRLKEKNIYAIAAAGHDGSISFVYDLKENFDIEKFWEEAYNKYKKIYGDEIIAKHYATDLLYELGVFKTESR